MAKVICYPITCSSDAETDIRRLYVWGEWESAKWLPTSREEAKRRIAMCKEKNKCQHCDAQIHKVVIERTKKTLMQNLSSKERKTLKKS